MKYDRGAREATSGSRGVGAHAIVAAARGTVQLNTPADFITNQYRPPDIGIGTGPENGWL